MGRPLAYEYKGTIYKGKSYPVYKDDTDPKLLYVVPPAMRVATNDDGSPKVNVSVCTSISKHSIKGLAMLEPYLPDDLIKAIKAEYGSDYVVGPLPLSNAGQVMVTDADAFKIGLTVDKPWNGDDPLSTTGMSPEQIQNLKKVRKQYEDYGGEVQLPVSALLPPEGGTVYEFPKRVGTNIGAEIPFSFLVRGNDAVKEYKGLLDAPGKAAFNGQIVYYYQGTTRPWSLLVEADMSKIHSYMNAKFAGGYYWAKADINVAVEELRRQEYIKITIWDENDAKTEKYKPEKIVDQLLDKILAAAFDKHDEIKPDKSEAKDTGGRWWWWYGSFSYKGSTAKFSDIFNFRMTIHGKSEPIPVSIGFFVTVPSYGTCDRVLVAEDMRDQIIKQVYTLDDEQLLDFGRSVFHLEQVEFG